MLNKLRSFIRNYRLLQPGDRVVCAVSGGADSVALLFSLYLLREQLGITLAAAHYNHGLRGAESDRDEQFVRQLCDRFDIPLTVGQGKVTAGKKGLEAAARDARYGFLKTLQGKIATAHTAEGSWGNRTHKWPADPSHAVGDPTGSAGFFTGIQLKLGNGQLQRNGSVFAQPAEISGYAPFKAGKSPAGRKTVGNGTAPAGG